MAGSLAGDQGQRLGVPFGAYESHVEGQLLEPQHQAEARKGGSCLGEFPRDEADAFDRSWMNSGSMESSWPTRCGHTLDVSQNIYTSVSGRKSAAGGEPVGNFA